MEAAMNTITGMTVEQIDAFCETMRVSLRGCVARGETVYLNSKMDVEYVEDGGIIIDGIHRGQTWVIKVGRPAERPAVREHTSQLPSDMRPIATHWQGDGMPKLRELMAQLDADVQPECVTAG